MNFARVAVFSIFITSPVYAGEYVLMQPSDAEALVEQCTRDTPAIEGSWQPSMADIEELEANIGKLKDIEATGCCGSGLLKGNPADYNRQYAGVIINGEQRIYINAVPGGWHGSKLKPQILCEGGKGAWGAVYNPKSNSFSDLALNG